MLDLVAIGPEPGQRWRREVVSDGPIRLGRLPQDGWDVPWDMRVSREHADLQLRGERLEVLCLPSATNPVYLLGEPYREVTVEPGSDFRIGETTFRLERVPEEIAAKVRRQPPARRENETVIVSELSELDVADLEASLSRVEAEASQANQLAEERSVEIHQLQTEIEALRAGIPDRQQTRRQLKDETAKAKKLAKEQTAEIHRLQEETERLGSQLEAGERQRVEARDRAEELQQVVDRLGEQRDALESRVNEAVEFASKATDQHEKQTAELRREIQQLTSDLSDLTNQRDALAQQLESVKEKPVAERKAREAAEQALAKAEESLREEMARARSLETTLQSVRAEHDSASASLQEATTRIQREQSAVEGLNAEREHLRSEVDTLRSRLISSEKSLAVARETADRHARQAEQRESEVKALQSAIASLRKHLEEKQDDLHDAETATRKKTDDVAKLSAEIDSLKIDIEALHEQVQDREASLEILRLENKEKLEETRQLRRLNEGLQDEVESLRSQVQSYSSKVRKSETQAQHEAREAQRFREQNDSLIQQMQQLKRKLAESSLSRIESISLAPEQIAPPKPPTIRGTDETLDQRAPDTIRPDDPIHVGQYRLLEKVGQGGMGVVYRALHTRLDKVVALKLLTEGRLRTPDHRARFDREMKAIGRLDHANLVRAHDAGESEGSLYLVMEYVDGMDIADMVRIMGQLPLPDACEIMRQAALGMAYVHRRKLVHRDLKPSNLMLTRGGTIKILDLGLAQLNDWGGEGLTQSGQIMGTLEYMAPEQAGDSRLVDYRADIYSLGCTFFEMLAGNSPFSDRGNETLAQLILAHATLPLPPLASLRPEVPADLVDLVGQMTAKAPKDRPKSMEDVAQQLANFCASASLSSLLANATSSRRHASTRITWKQEIGGRDKEDTSDTCSAELGTHTSTPGDELPSPAEPQRAPEAKDEAVTED